MSCPGLEELEQYATGILGDEARGRVEAHVSNCAPCQERVIEIARNVEIAGRVNRIAGPSSRNLADAPFLGASEASGTTPDPAAAKVVTITSGPGTPELPPEDAFPGYTIVRELSRGGQGVVYQAIQKSTKRKVAIKVLREGHFADAREKVRFEREVQILGQLKHPNIVTIYDSGSVAGNAYYVMDYIAGGPLDEHIAERRLSLEDTLRLFAKACDAVHAAHLRGIIHRDLKPSNIRVDADGEPHILDFGLAKVAASLDTEHSPTMTETGQFLGSLPWSSPEQAEGQPSRVDSRTDVYCLGVVLYRVLSGTFPYEVVGTLRDVLDRIVRAEPRRLSAALRARNPEERERWVPTDRSSSHSRSLLARWWPRLGAAGSIDDDLETIVLTCLEKDRERRYQSAGELARDLRRYLAGEPIAAKRGSGWYLLRKAIRRYRVQLSVAAGFVLIVTLAATVSVAWILLLTLTLALLISTTAWRRAAQARDRALVAQQRAQGVIEFLHDVFAMANPLSARQASRPVAAQRAAPYFVGQAGRAPTVLELLSAAVRWLDELHLDPLLEAEIRHIVGSTLADMGRFEDGVAQIRSAFEVRARLCGPNALETLQSRRRLADALLLKGDKEESLALARSAYDRLRTTHGAGHTITLAFAAITAEALEKSGRQEEAIELLRNATDAASGSARADRDQVVLRRLDLARILTESNQSRESLRITEQCMRDLTGRPEGRRLYAQAADVRAQILFNLGRFRDAEQASREAVRAHAEEYGRDHPLTAFQMIYLARNLSENGALREALRVAEESLEIQRRAMGSEHLWTYRAERCLVRQLVRLRIDQDLAEAMAQHAAAGYARVYSPEHEYTLYARDAEALALQQQGRLEEAEAILRENARIGKHTVQGWWYARHLESLGLCLAERGAYAEAEQQLVAAWEHIAQNLGSDAEPAQEIARQLVRLYGQWHAAAPGNGYDQKAGEWRAKLQTVQSAT